MTGPCAMDAEAMNNEIAKKDDYIELGRVSNGIIDPKSIMTESNPCRVALDEGDEMKMFQTLSTLPTVDDNESLYLFYLNSCSGEEEDESLSYLTSADMHLSTKSTLDRSIDEIRTLASEDNEENVDMWKKNVSYGASCTNSKSEGSLYFDDDLISTGSLLSTVQRLQDMLHRAESTKLELSKQLSNIPPRRQTSISSDGERSVDAGDSTCSDSTPTNSNDDDSSILSGHNTRSKTSRFAFPSFAPFRKGSRSTTTTKAKTKTTTKTKTKQMDANQNDDDLRNINVALRDTVSELQTILSEKEKHIVDTEHDIQEYKARVKKLDMENRKLAEETARVEVQYMNKMHEMQRDFESRLKIRDARIAFLTWELNAMGFDGERSVLETT